MEQEILRLRNKYHQLKEKINIVFEEKISAT
jgi:hypothetical protein